MENETDGQVPPPRPLATRSLMAASDPARRLQELLREQASADAPAPEAAPPPQSAPVPVAPAPIMPLTAAVPIPPAEIIRLSITLDGARLDPTEYYDRAAVPTRAELEQTHRAYVLRDQWAKSDAGTTWIVYMRRKTR